MTTAEDREWRTNLFTDVVTDTHTRLRVGFHIGAMRQPGDPDVTPSDVQAARNYLRTCMDHMPISELEKKDWEDLAALWARGAVGAARYRSRSGRPFRREERQRTSPEDEK